MSLLSIQVIDKSPLVLTYVAVSSTGIDSVQNTTAFDVVLNVKNDSGSDVVVSISAVVPDDQGGYNDISEVISTGTIGTFPLHSRITNWTTRQNTIRYSTVTDISVAVFRILR